MAGGRKLMLGGIEVPFDKGPVGHSDGDALAHAICDALLGAAGLGDIGTHFPDNDPQWKGAASLRFLEHVRSMLAQQRLRIAAHRRHGDHRAAQAGSALPGHAQGAGRGAGRWILGASI